jgi:DNA processing protein
LDPRTHACLFLAWFAMRSGRAILRLQKTHGAEQIWAATKAQLRAWGLSEVAALRLVEGRRLFPAAQLEREIEQSGTSFLPLGADSFPDVLTHLEVPPAGVFVEGGREVLERLLETPRITVVGTRKASPYGLAAAASFAAAFGRSGIAVVSGLALGVDGRAHQACLQVGGLTAAVLGCGCDVVYPVSHRALHGRIRREGVLLSEYPPGTPPARWFFPERNRIMAALGDACLVVEAGAKSGALGTASWASELGRLVISIPGPVIGGSHRGCNELIYEGALPAIEPELAVEDFLRETRRTRGGRGAEIIQAVFRPAAEDLGSSERLLVLALGSGARSVDELVGAAGLCVREVATALCRLELRGDVVKAGPGRYMLVS